MAERADADDDDAEAESGRGGRWLTYRYRLGGGDAPAQGTIKAPSFLSAARRLLERRLGAHLGAQPAYLRLRAAGEAELLLRVTPSSDGGGAPRLEVVPPETFRFEEPDDL
jgi:hypothetical protein